LLAYPSFACIETMQTARFALRNFLWNKKMGNAHSKLLAYPSFAYIQTMQNGKVHFAQFPMVSLVSKQFKRRGRF